MEYDIQRQDVTAAVRPVPTDNTLAVMPLTLDRVGRELEDGEDAAPVRLNSVEDAFARFQPRAHIEHTANDAQFAVDLEFNALRDFDPDKIMTRKSPSQRNDLADLNGRIQILQQLRTRFAQQKVKKAWGDEKQRAALIEAVRQFQTTVGRIAEGK